MDKGADRNAKEFPALTGLRAVAAEMVVLHNFGFYGPGLVPVALEKALNLGVNLFFVLSGFLIMRQLAAAPDLDWSVLKGYYWRRIARLYPLFAILFGLVLLHRATTGLPFLDANSLRSLFLVQGYFAMPEDLPQTWSLTTELTFYALAPLIFIYRRRVPLWVQQIACYAIGGVLFAVACRMPGLGLVDDIHLFLYTDFFARSFSFFAGAALAFRGLKPFGASTYAGALLLVASVAFESQSKSEVLEAINFYYVNSIAAALLIWGLATERTWISRALGSRIGVALGNASYALFLVHYRYFGEPMLDVFTDLKIAAPAAQLLCFVIVNAMALLLHRYVEQPMYAWVTSRRRVPKPALSLEGPLAASESMLSFETLKVLDDAFCSV